MKVLIITPAFNEASSLPATIKDIRTHCPDYPVLVVNDCSTDNTAEVATCCGVKVINTPINLGIGGAVQTGFKWAVQNGFDIGIQFDGDGQHQASYIPELLSHLKDGVDLVIGSRFLRPLTAFKTTFARRTGMIIFSTLFYILTGQKIMDTTSGFRAYSCRLLSFYTKNYPVDFPDMPALLAARRNGFRMIEIPVTMNQRLYGVSSTGFWKSVIYPIRTIMASLAVHLSKRVTS